MSKKSKREIEREVDELRPDDDGSNGGPFMLVITGLGVPEGKRWPDIEDSPHPELTVKPWAEQKPGSLKVAVPNLLAEPWFSADMLVVHTCENADKHLLERNQKGSETVAACELWNALDDDDLEREREIREANDDPLPPILEE